MTGPGQHRRHSLGKHDTQCNVTTSLHTDFPAVLSSYLECLFHSGQLGLPCPSATPWGNHTAKNMKSLCTQPAQYLPETSSTSHCEGDTNFVASNIFLIERRNASLMSSICKYVLKPLLKHIAFWFCCFKRAWNGRNFSSFSSVHGSLCKCR